MFSEPLASEFLQGPFLILRGGYVLLILESPRELTQKTLDIYSGEMHKDKCTGNVGGSQRSLHLN